MRLPVKILLGLNKLFPPVPHPFNLQNEGKLRYNQWQYQQGERTIACFAPKYGKEEMFSGKRVLDLGCGAAGKSLYYISCGASEVVGLDIVPHYKAEAEAFAEELGYQDRFTFILGSALETGLPDAGFDTIVMNDFMEHISEPETAAAEALRLLRPGGRIYVNFPPYYHPYGAHLSDAIGIPWVHLFFSERTMIEAYKHLIRGLPDERERLDLRFSKDENGVDHLTYINKMTIRRFRGILKKLGVTPLWYREIPLRRILTPLVKLPGVKGPFVRMCVCVIEKPQGQAIGNKGRETPAP